MSTIKGNLTASASTSTPMADATNGLFSLKSVTATFGSKLVTNTVKSGDIIDLQQKIALITKDFDPDTPLIPPKAGFCKVSSISKGCFTLQDASINSDGIFVYRFVVGSIKTSGDQLAGVQVMAQTGDGSAGAGGLGRDGGTGQASVNTFLFVIK